MFNIYFSVCIVICTLHIVNFADNSAQYEMVSVLCAVKYVQCVIKYVQCVVKSG